MSYSLIAILLILISVFLLVAEDIAWEKLSISTVHKIGDRTNARSTYKNTTMSEIVDTYSSLV
jgi:hypothetical protein